MKNFWVLHSDVFPDLGFDSLGFRGIIDVRLSTPGNSLTNVNIAPYNAIACDILASIVLLYAFRPFSALLALKAPPIAIFLHYTYPDMIFSPLRLVARFMA